MFSFLQINSRDTQPALIQSPTDASSQLVGRLDCFDCHRVGEQRLVCQPSASALRSSRLREFLFLFCLQARRSSNREKRNKRDRAKEYKSLGEGRGLDSHQNDLLSITHLFSSFITLHAADGIKVGSCPQPCALPRVLQTHLFILSYHHRLFFPSATSAPSNSRASTTKHDRHSQHPHASIIAIHCHRHRRRQRHSRLHHRYRHAPCPCQGTVNPSKPTNCSAAESESSITTGDNRNPTGGVEGS